MLIFSSTIVLIIIGFGLYFRHQRRIHIPLMLLAFVCDLTLVLVIEFQRAAVEKVISNVQSSPDYFLLFHASVSLLVLVLYIAMIVTGLRYLTKKTSSLTLHRNLAAVFLVLRLVNYVTSFWMAGI